MRVDTFLTLLVCASQLLLDSAQDSALRVVGGRDSRPGEYPFLVRLMIHIIYKTPNKTSTSIIGGCTGAALSSTWTLTAGHCLHSDGLIIDNKTMTTMVEIKRFVAYGDPHLKPSENNKLSAVLNTRQCNYKLRSASDDIGMLHTEPINITKYGRISAIDYTALYGSPVTLMGFGMMRASQKLNDLDFTFNLDKPLQVMHAMLKSCIEDKVKETGMQICAVPECGRNQWLLYGDSGGPVVQASGIVGVNTALGHKQWDKKTTKPSSLILTPISPFVNWIYSQVNTGHIDK